MGRVYREFALAARLNQPVPPEGIYWLQEGKSKYSIRTYSTFEGPFAIVINETQNLGHKEWTEENFMNREKYIRARCDVSDIKYLWAAQKYMPADYLLYIGTSPMENNVYIATGFSFDGLIYGTVPAIIISNLILKEENTWAVSFSGTVASGAGTVRVMAAVSTTGGRCWKNRPSGGWRITGKGRSEGQGAG
jgi:glycine/D-amino acid oxidase-like deaminating enzyme